METPSHLLALKDKLQSGFFGFWIKKRRISYLLIFCILVLGIISLISLPKESSPAIKFGIITIATPYPGTNPNDVDSLISDKFYKEIKDIQGIDKINSQSRLGMSLMTLTLKAGVNTKDILNEVRNNINRVILPNDAKTPIITEIDTNTKMIFELYMYGKKPNTSKELLLSKAKIIKDGLEKLSSIESVEFAGGEDYELHIIFDKVQLKNSGLTIENIANSIRNWNKDTPIGNFELGEKKYDFRIEGKANHLTSLLNIPLNTTQDNSLKIGDIASIEKVYKDKSIDTFGNKSLQGLPFITLVVNKTSGTSIFKASGESKNLVTQYFSKASFGEFLYAYGQDAADIIQDDYKDLTKEALLTLTLVFIAMYLFVGFRDSLFASLTLPLAFLSTFILLFYGGFTLNFLTNFSLILSFGIAVDTIIVIVQAASAKIRIGYDPESAIMLALREYSIPIISGVMTTIVVFIPMMFLPGIMGKFLAYIPITIFGVLACGLFLALTVNSALYLLFVKKQTKYIHDDTTLEYAHPEEKELLLLERKGKTQIESAHIPIRIKIIHFGTNWYKRVLSAFLKNTLVRRLSIVVPVVVLILSFFFLAPKVGYELFPSGDNGFLSFSIEGTSGLKTQKMREYTSDIDGILKKYPEIKYYTLSTLDNKTTIDIQLYKLAERKKAKQRNIFELEKSLLQDFGIYEMKGLKVLSQVLKNGPPGGKAIGLKLTAQKSEDLEALIDVAKKFEIQLKTIKGTKNVSLSSTDTPGQFIFTLKKEVLGTYHIPPSVVTNIITQTMNGINVGSLEDDGIDMNIYVKQSNFRDSANINDILNTSFVFGGNTYQVGSFVNYNLKNSIASVTREDGKININVEADLEKGMDSVKIQSQLEAFAENYDFPSGISYLKGGETEANKELITAVLSSFFIAIMIIFAILTLQFNSYSQPLIILYSVIMSLPFVMVGLLLTGNKFSLPFGIGFIAFTGIAVNHGIILIDAINQNLKKGMVSFQALIEAGTSRLEPMLLTTFTTVLGIFPIAFQDEFWSGMGFTIIFGIIAASTLTLFVLKGIYYEIYLRPKKVKKAKKEDLIIIHS